MSTSSQRSRFSNKGFTLIELVVVVAIIAIITSTLLLRQSRFDSSTLLRTLGYSVALSARQAQVYGTSVFGTSTLANATFAPGYGLYFCKQVSPGCPTGFRSYILFADFNSSGRYEAGEAVQTFQLNQGYSISEFCAITASAKRCDGVDDSGGAPGSVSFLTIVFKRPNPDAQFVALKSDGTPISPPEIYTSAYIQVKAQDSANDTWRSVTVTSSGQITVQPPKTLP